ncbi:transcriptional regulator, LacI family [Lachnospiraceae bacterium KH1T2]|nr:transcriptional regulator, LacI family [Lachnospiraceae bacterium KH1T2]
MATRITIQDIADALNLSRNTVSKAINNTGTIADATRDMVLKKAAEMGYKQFSYIDIDEKKIISSNDKNNHMELAFVTTAKLDNAHFGSTMIDKIQQELSEINCSLSIYRVLPAEMRECKLPGSLDISRISGIFCAEIFNKEYCRMLSSLEIPVLFIDSPCLMGETPLAADILLMDNETYSYTLINKLKKRGVTNIGFVGDIYHCRSFYERYTAFRNSLNFYDLPYNQKYCLEKSEGDNWGETFIDYPEYLLRGVEKMKELPDIFICANDFVAIDLLRGLRKLKISVPDDVMLCGFDDSQESNIVMPSLSTVHIHSQLMGHEAVELLLSRIKEPSLNFRTIHAETDLILRESTSF